MNKRMILILGLVLALVITTVASAASVTPVPFPNAEIGDAAFYCVTTLDYDFGIKIEAWGDEPGVVKQPKRDRVYDGRGSFVDDYANPITISEASRFSFDWASAEGISSVIVQGGPMDNIFFYSHPIFAPNWEPQLSDTDLYPYDSGSAKREMISHVNFCWNRTGEDDDDDDDEPEPMCYQEETAWAANGDVAGEIGYVGANQWATYVEYFDVEKTVTLFAGQTIPIGTATFSAPVDGSVTITVDLDYPWIFYFDLFDIEVDDNLKVQDYEFPPEGNPAIGLFDWKTFIPVGSTEGEIVVPENNFYGVHLDVALEYDCDDPPADE